MNVSEFRHLWLAWGIYFAWCVASVAAWFAVVECMALRNRIAQDTLTEVTRSLHIPMVVWFIAGGLLLGAVAGFVVWWPVHLRWGL